ncbi:MAG: DUF4388 domain-containing protein [Thermoanaerobaculia bacterium]
MKHPSPTSALSGDLADFNLAHLLDILQIVCKSGILTVKSGNGNAHIQIVNGQPTRAKFGRFDSEQALVAVMRFEKGVCSFEEGALRSDLGSSLPSGVPVQALQLTAAIQKDEARRVESYVPVLQAKLRSQTETWSANQSKLPPFPIGDVYSRIVEHTNGSFRKLLDRAIAPPDMVRAAVGWLIRQGVVASSL